MNFILGLNAFHGDSSACLVKDGELIAAAEEERFRRIKHWAGFPEKAIRYCLKAGNIDLEQIDYIAVNRNPYANLLKKFMFAFKKRPSLNLIKDRLTNTLRIKDIKEEFSNSFGIDLKRIKAQVRYIGHHQAHLASSFFVSPYDSASLISVDGFGDFVSTMWGLGRGSQIHVKDQIYFPHSLGLFYLALTQYLGFLNYGDEYKVMGLAPYGKPIEMEKMYQIILLKDNGYFELNLDYFIHHSKGVSMTWNNGFPEMGKIYSDYLPKLLGPARQHDEPISDHHKNIAASLQQMYENTFFHILNHVYKKTQNPVLCLSGGCAMNSVANGKIFDKTPFKELYIQSAAGDGGGAIGSAFMVWHNEMKNPRSFVMDHAYFGPEYSVIEIKYLLDKKKNELKYENCRVEHICDETELCTKTASQISMGKIIGWFQGRMEWGPRALGNRSIICDPRRADMKDILNLKIKRRESFRPFAPSILREAVKDWFETDYEVPYMLQVYQIKKNKQEIIPAVTHVNGSGRLQTVNKSQNPLYYQVIKEFENITKVPIVLNTSFNENEPVVCTPEEALNCFLRTQMDILVLGSFFIQR